MSRFDLNGKVAIVTGGGSGIGKAISLAYANAGANVVVAARGAERLEAAAEEIRGLGRRALAVSTDVTEPDQVDALIERTTHEMGKVDIMVANSGGGGSPKLEDITLEDWENQMRLNLSSAFLCDVSAGKAMIARADHQHLFDRRNQPQPRAPSLRSCQGRHDQLHQKPGPIVGR